MPPPPFPLLETTEGGSLRAAVVLSTDSPPRPLHMGSMEAISRVWCGGPRGALRTSEDARAGKDILELLRLLVARALFVLALEQVSKDQCDPLPTISPLASSPHGRPH